MMSLKPFRPEIDKMKVHGMGMMLPLCLVLNIGGLKESLWSAWDSLRRRYLFAKLTWDGIRLASHLRRGVQKSDFFQHFQGTPTSQTGLVNETKNRI